MAINILQVPVCGKREVRNHIITTGNEENRLLLFVLLFNLVINPLKRPWYSEHPVRAVVAWDVRAAS